MNNVAMDMWLIFQSPQHSKNISEKGIIFMSISEAIKEHPELVRNI
jgi:Fe-S cluster assembly protein SufB